MKFSFSIDWLLLLPSIILSTIGLLIIFSIDQYFFRNQLIFAIIGIILFFFISKIDFKILEKFNFVFLAFSVFLLGLTLILGQATKGSIRWLKFGFFGFQPSEFVKPLLIVCFAAGAAKLKKLDIKNLLILFLILSVPNFLIFRQPDLGNSLVVLAIWLTIIWAAGLSNWIGLISLLMVLLFRPIIWNFLKPYQQQRILTFLNPGSDPLGSGYHIIQSIISVGSGQLFGQGLGRGGQSQLKYLPENHTDFIFATLSEELGFLGSSILIICYFILLARILLLAKKNPSKFGYLICLGVFAMLFFQVFINISMNLGIAPVTGITLPFISSGGSSIISTFICLGLVQSASNFLKRKEVIEIY